MLFHKRGSQPAERPLASDVGLCKKPTAKIEWRIYFLTGRSLRLAPRVITVSSRYFGVACRAARRSWQRRQDASRGYGSPYQRRGEEGRLSPALGEPLQVLTPEHQLSQPSPLSGSRVTSQ
jgi:hypothetical protein